MSAPLVFRRLAEALALAACLTLVAPAMAQSDAARVEQLVEQATADYDMLALDGAQAKLAEAIVLVEQRGVRTPAAAQAYIMSGVINYALTGDSSSALNPFVEALLIDSSAEIHPFYATPTLQEVMGQARLVVPEQSAPPQPPPPVPPPVQPPPPPAAQIEHVPVREGIAGREVVIQARVPVSVPAARVVLNFKTLRDAAFYAVDLAPQADGVSFAGEIPSAATQGQVQVEYFVAAYDRAGNLLTSTASAQGPHVVTLLGGFDGPSERAPRAQRDGNIVHLGLGVGTGFGLATQSPRANGDLVDLNPGLASTPLHLGFELGIAPTRGAVHAVPFLRLQMVSLDTGLEIEPLFGLKVRYFLQTERKLRLYVQGGLGYGDIIHFVSLPDIDGGVVDTTVEGNLHVGPGFGFAYWFSDHVALSVDSYLMVLFPRTSVHLDLTAGLTFGF